MSIKKTYKYVGEEVQEINKNKELIVWHQDWSAPMFDWGWADQCRGWHHTSKIAKLVATLPSGNEKAVVLSDAMGIVINGVLVRGEKINRNPLCNLFECLLKYKKEQIDIPYKLEEEEISESIQYPDKWSSTTFAYRGSFDRVQDYNTKYFVATKG